MRRRLCPHKHRANMSIAPTTTGMPPAFIIVQVALVILALVPIVAGVDLNSRTVKTKYGDLKGVIVKLERNLGGVEVFRGVPYASPPVGSLRFMPPVNGAPWHGVKVADKFGPVCPQKLPELTNAMPPGRMEYLRRLLPLLRNQSEDCLYLNIYAPAQGEMVRILTVVIAVGVMHVVAADVEKYSDKYDSIDIDAILSNDRLREHYYNCFIDAGPCSDPAEKFVRDIFADAITTKCGKCTEKQKMFFGKIVEWFTTNQEDKWKALLAKGLEDAKAAKSAAAS